MDEILTGLKSKSCAYWTPGSEAHLKSLDILANAIEHFFNLPKFEKQELCGEFRYFRGDRIVGYKEEDSNEFVEMRFSGNSFVPRIASPVKIRGGVQVLVSLARKILGAISVEIGVDIIKLSDIDIIGKDESVSESAVRLCCYSARSQHCASPSFGAHTDTTFLTLTLIGKVSGLRVLANEEWVDVEEGREGCVLVMIGEYLEVISRGLYRACVHKVVGPPSTRLSSPLLIRCHEASSLKTLHGKEISMGVLKRFIDSKRKLISQKHGSSEAEWILSSHSS